jgi:hypothetical protein
LLLLGAAIVLVIERPAQGMFKTPDRLAENLWLGGTGNAV